MTTKPVLDDEQPKEALVPAVGGAERQPDGPALERPIRQNRKKDLTELADRIRLRDGYGHGVLWPTRFGVG